MIRGESSLTFGEYLMHEPLPLAEVQEAVLDFLQNRADAAIFGAQAVNAYVSEPRMSQGVDILSTRAADLAEEIREHLEQRFGIAVRVRRVARGQGYRVCQLRKEGNRHLVDVRHVRDLPRARRLEGILVPEPEELLALKLISYHNRKGRPKAGTDWRDLAMLLLAFPHLKAASGPVRQRLVATGADAATLSTWEEIVAQEFSAIDEEDGF